MSVRFYFHLRSPYSWLAVEQIARDPFAFEGFPIADVPASMTPGGSDPAVNRRLSYIVEDVARIAGSMGVPIAFPDPFDTDWIRPNAAFWHAQSQGKGLAFLHAAYGARWREGRDLGDAGVITGVAETAGLAPEPVVAAMDDPGIHGTLNGFVAQREADGVCGVPFFVYEGQKYWGQDRLSWLRAALAQAD